MREVAVERFIVNNLEELFPELTLVETREVASNRFEVDLHLRDEELNDVFIEIMSTPVRNMDVGRILNYYTILSNTDGTRNMRFILLTEGISEKARDIFEGFGVEVILFGDLSITEEDVDEFQLEELRNVLTPTESEVLSYIKERDCSVVDVRDVGDYFDVDGGYASKLLERLEKKDYLERIKYGKYMFIPLEYGYEDRYPPMNSLVVGSVLTSPYYYGYQTANRYHGFTSQFSPTTYICTTKPKRTFNWRSIKYKFVTLVERKFFGYKKTLSDGCIIFVAEPEKAVLDSVDKPDYCGGVPQALSVIANAFTKELKKGVLLDYALRMGSNSVIQRLGYLTELLCNEKRVEIDEDFLKSVEGLLPRDVSNTFLGPVGRHGRKGTLNDRWNIIENIEFKELTNELEVR